jgi:hypothetical protein
MYWEVYSIWISLPAGSMSPCACYGVFIAEEIGGMRDRGSGVSTTVDV